VSLIAALWGRRGPEPPRRPHQATQQPSQSAPAPAKRKERQEFDAPRTDYTAHLLAQAAQKSTSDGRGGQVAELRKNAIGQARRG
jgi:hypothetical protein